MDQINLQLQQIGLSDYESQVYEKLLLASPLGATIIAKKCGYSRSTVYTVLDSLIAKGLVSITYKNEVKQFMAEDLTSLKGLIAKEKELVAKKERVIAGLASKIKVLAHGQLNLPQIIFFEGQEGLKKIYMSMMRQAPENSTLYLLRDEFIWRDEWNFVFEAEWKQRIARLKAEKNISTCLLINDSKIENAKRATYNENKYLKHKYLPKKRAVKDFALYIIGDTISILSIEKNNLVGIKITNQNLADNFRQNFILTWELIK